MGALPAGEHPSDAVPMPPDTPREASEDPRIQRDLAMVRDLEDAARQRITMPLPIVSRGS